MEQVKKLDKRYFMLKIEDLDKYFSNFQHGVFATKEEQEFMDTIPFNKVLMDIDKQRKLDSKHINKEYLVLNLDDDIDLIDIKYSIVAQIMVKDKPYKVKDIAVPLVNAILKAKEE